MQVPTKAGDLPDPARRVHAVGHCHEEYSQLALPLSSLHGNRAGKVRFDPLFDVLVHKRHAVTESGAILRENYSKLLLAHSKRRSFSLAATPNFVKRSID